MSANRIKNDLLMEFTSRDRNYRPTFFRKYEGCSKRACPVASVDVYCVYIEHVWYVPAGGGYKFYISDKFSPIKYGLFHLFKFSAVIDGVWILVSN